MLNKLWSCWGAWINTKSDCSWPWRWGPDTPMSVQTQTGKEAATKAWWEAWWELNCLCFQSETKALLSGFSLSMPQLAHPSSGLALRENNFSGPTAGIKTSLPPTSPQKGTERQEACRGLGPRQAGEMAREDPNRAWSILAPLLNFPSLPLQLFNFIHYFNGIWGLHWNDGNRGACGKLAVTFQLPRKTIILIWSTLPASPQSVKLHWVYKAFS